MEFATGALGTLLPKLGQLLQDEYNLQKGAKKDIEFLKRELERMHACLRSVGEVPADQLNELVKMWAHDVRELSYDMEDIVDTFLVHVQGPEPTSKRSTKRYIQKMLGVVTKHMSHHDIDKDIKHIKERVKEMAERRDRNPNRQKRTKRFIKKMIGVVTKSTTRHEIVQGINDIKERVKEVAERHNRYIADTPSAKTLVDPRITALYTKASNLVGIDEAREELITRLMKEEDVFPEQRRVSIVGSGGLGKTTLAKAVYDKLKAQFNCMAFVSVSRNPEIEKIFKDILYELDKTEYKNIYNTTMGLTQLMDLVIAFLQNKRYLIIIDDIWDTGAWDIIQCALLENGKKSRIIITTRIIDVAEHVGGCYKMKPLTHETSKLLFYRRIFGSGDKCPDQFSDVSGKILNKCGGVPLAIITISSLLANKSGNIKEWYNVCDSIGSGLGNNPEMDNMRKILLLSYYDLKPHLKTCLLYLSIFPEDYEIRRARLILKWIAEGFVQHGEGCQSLWETGQSYFNELLNRSLIQPEYLGGDDRFPISCRVHDMVLDLICSLSKKECFATIVSADSKHDTSSSGTKVRRLSLHCTTWPTIDSSKIRSLTISCSSIINSRTPLSCCNFLRVLDLEDCNLENHPSLEFVGKLFHLRYLSLAGTRYGGKVPEDIENVQFLQTLDLWGTCIEELPLSILRLRQLMCLRVGGSTRLPTAGFKNLSSLEALRVTVDSAYLAEKLGHLTELRLLVVNLTNNNESRWDASMCNVLVSSIGKLRNLQSLVIESSGGVAVNLGGSVEWSLCSLCHLLIDKTNWLPTWIDPASFPLLSHLDIAVGQVLGKDIYILGSLKALRWLKVKVVPGSSEKQVFKRFTISNGTFPSVTQCRFTGFSMVPSMFTLGAMPKLQYFKFHIPLEDFNTAGIIVDDLALGHLPSLHTVRVRLSGEQSVRKENAVIKVEEALRHEVDVHLNHPDTFIRTDGNDWIQC
ncbi:hypothetical protein U9M48_001370, partial [Paspalum notatum var. saurae]